MPPINLRMLKGKKSKRATRIMRWCSQLPVQVIDDKYISDMCHKQWKSWVESRGDYAN